MRLLTVARLQERKNHLRVVRSVIRLIRNGWVPSLEYDIVGDGALRDNILKLVNDAGLSSRIRVYPSVGDSELKGFYKCCDVFILPSLCLPGDVEGFGMVYLEAGLFSKPVIAGHRGGSTDVVFHGVNGILVDAESEDRIAEAIYFLSKNPEVAVKMGAENFKIAKGLSWDLQVKKICEVFKTCH